MSEGIQMAEYRPKVEPEAKPLPPFSWQLMDGAEMWTDNSSVIGTMSDPPIIDGMLRNSEVASIVGGAKSCKTWFALRLGLAVATGDDFLGFKVHRRRVLYLDYELKDGTFRKRMCMLADSKPSGFLYQLLRGAARLPSVADIAEIIRKEDIGLVVVDSLYRTGWLTEENSNDSTGAELTPIQRLASDTGASVIVIDHTAKGGGDGRSAVDASRGASAKGGFFDGIFVLRPTDQGPDPEGNYVILDPVVRDWPGFRNHPLMSFSWSATSATIDLAGEVDPGAANNDTTVILSKLAECDHPVRVSFLSRETEISEGRTRRALAKLKEKVVETPDPSHPQAKVYRLADIGDAA